MPPPGPQPNFNFIFNGDFEIWGGGTNAAPTGWAVGGAPGISKEGAIFKIGAASAKSANVSGAAAELTQDIDLIAGFGPAAWWGGKTVTAGAWVRSDTVSAGRIQIDDGTTTTSSSFTPSTSTWTFLTVTAILQATPTRVRVHMRTEVNSSTYWDGAILVIGSSLTDFIPSGWRGRKSILSFADIVTGLPQNTTRYYNSAGLGTVDATGPVPFKGVARNLESWVHAAAGAGQSFTFTLRKNNVDTLLVSTISGAASQTASDTTDEVTFSKTDLINLKGVSSATATNGVQAVNYIEYEEIP